MTVGDHSSHPLKTCDLRGRFASPRFGIATRTPAEAIRTAPGGRCGRRHRRAVAPTPGRLSALVVGLLVIAAPLAAAAGPAEPPAPPAGATFREPEVRSSRGGLLDTQLEVAQRPTVIGGRTVNTLTYEGGMPGPTIRLRPGDRWRFRLINNLGNPSGQKTIDCAHQEREHGPETGSPDPFLTNIHTHGLQVSPSGNADNPLIRLRSGETCNYDIQLPPDHPAGLFWYHPHGHPGSVQQSWAGLAGAIIVEGDLDQLPGVKEAEEHVMILQELFVDDTGNLPRGMPIPTASPGASPFGAIPAVPTEFIHPINGVLQPSMTIRPGQTQRWRILNASAHRLYRLSLEGHSLYQIAQDGLTLSETEAHPEILLAPGNRAEVIVKGAAPGTFRLRALPYDQGHPGGPMPEVDLATLTVAGAPMDSPLPGRLLPQRDLRQEPVAGARTVEWDGSILQAPVQFYINHRQFEPDRVDETVPVGRVEEWTLLNNDVFRHPFHIHVNPFQVVEVNGAPFPDPGAPPSWWDTFPLPPRTMQDGKPVPGEVKIRMYFRPDIVGTTVFHCHILPHQDNGMMALMDLAAPDAPPASAGAPPETTPGPPLPLGPPTPMTAQRAPGAAPPGASFTAAPLPPEPRPVGEPPTPRPEPLYALTQHICLVPSPRASHPQPPPTAAVGQRPLCQAQFVPTGATVEIQLPGTPSTWTLLAHSPTVAVVHAEPRRFPSPGRIPGTSEIYVFDFRIVAPGPATITVGESPAFVASSGVFTYTLVGIPPPVNRLTQQLLRRLGVAPPPAPLPPPLAVERRRAGLLSG